MFHQVRSFWKSLGLSEYKNHRCQVCHNFVPSLSSVYTNVNLKTVLWFSSASQNSSLLRVLSHVLDCQLLKHVHMVSFKKAAQPSLLTSSPGINQPSPQVLASAAPTPVQCVEVSPGDQWLNTKTTPTQWMSMSGGWRRLNLHPSEPSGEKTLASVCVQVIWKYVLSMLNHHMCLNKDLIMVLISFVFVNLGLTNTTIQQDSF